MKIIMKISSLIILLLFMMSNSNAPCDPWNTTVTDLGGAPATFNMTIDSALPSDYGSIDPCDNACVIVTLTNNKRADIFVESSNGYYWVFQNTTSGSAMICFGQDSGNPLDLPLTRPQEIVGGILGVGLGINQKSMPVGFENVCTVMIEGP